MFERNQIVECEANINDFAVYDNALMTLKLDVPWSYVPAYHEDILLPNLMSLEAEQLLSCAFVLDMLSTYFKPYTGDKKYTQLTEELLKLQFVSTSVAVNSIAQQMLVGNIT